MRISIRRPVRYTCQYDLHSETWFVCEDGQVIGAMFGEAYARADDAEEGRHEDEITQDTQRAASATAATVTLA